MSGRRAVPGAKAVWGLARSTRTHFVRRMVLSDLSPIPRGGRESVFSGGHVTQYFLEGMLGQSHVQSKAMACLASYQHAPIKPFDRRAQR